MEKVLANRMAVAFNSPHLFATSLLLLLLDLFDAEVINWDMHTIRQELRDELGVELNHDNDQKIQAVLTMLCSDSFMHDPIVFSAVARALGNEDPMPDLTVPLDPDLAAWCLTEAAFLGVDDMQNGLSDDVKRFLGVCLSYAGIHQRPRCMIQAILPDPDVQPAETSDIDPDIQSAYMKKNQEESGSLDDFVRNRARQLMDQLTRLPMQHRNNDSWAKFYTKVQKSLAA